MWDTWKNCSRFTVFPCVPHKGNYINLLSFHCHSTVILLSFCCVYFQCRLEQGYLVCLKLGMTLLSIIFLRTFSEYKSYTFWPIFILMGKQMIQKKSKIKIQLCSLKLQVSNRYLYSKSFIIILLFQQGIKVNIKYRFEEKGSSLCKCSILLGSFMSKKLERLRSELLS